MLSAVSLERLSYLEVNPAALALASDELQERFRRQVATAMVRRLGAVSAQLAEHAPAAVRARRGLPMNHDLQLLDS
jgi:non-specific serine/threonine protein kinase